MFIVNGSVTAGGEQRLLEQRPAVHSPGRRGGEQPSLRRVNEGFVEAVASKLLLEGRSMLPGKPRGSIF